MAITLDNFAHDEVNATTSTKSVTVASGSNKALLVLITGYGTPGSQSTSVVFNGDENFTYIAGSYADNGDSQYVEAWYLVNPTATTANVVSTFGASRSATINIWSLAGVDQSTPIGAVDEDGDTNGDTPYVSSITTTEANSLVLQVVGTGGTTASGRMSPASGQTERLDIVGGSGNYDTWAGDLAVAVAGATSINVNDTIDNNDWNQRLAIEVLIAVSAATVDQEGFAFGDDDGNEAAHTLDTQDADNSSILGAKTLRFIVDATDDPDSFAYKLKYQKGGSGGYVDVPVGSTSLNDVVIEAGDCTRSGSNSTSTTIGLTLPAYSSGDLVIINIGYWADNNDDQGVTWPSGPDSETITEIENDYGPPATNADLEVYAFGWYIATDDYVGGTLNITADEGTRWDGVVVVVPNGEFNITTPISSASSQDYSADNTTDLDLPAFSANANDTGGKLVVFVIADQDPIESTPPVGYSALVTHDMGRVAIQLAVRDSAVTTSESIAKANFGLAGAGTDAMIVYGYIVRPPTATSNEVYVSVSANVAAGGEATTARLTAPSGKSGDFTTGRRWDDENGNDSINIGDSYYTELEWILTTQSPATTDDYFEFRVYEVDTVLDSYTETPKWTIASSGGGPAGIKTVNDTITASVKTINEIAIASIKTINDSAA